MSPAKPLAKTSDAGPTDLRQRLATLRLLTGLFALCYLVGRLPHFGSVPTSANAHFRPVGLATLLDVPLGAGVTWTIALATAATGVAFVAGYRFRFFGPAFAVGMLWVTSYRSSFGMIFHTENLLVLHLLVLSVSPAADAWALGGQSGGDRTAPTHKPWRYGWAIVLISAVTVATYFVAGVAKMRLAGSGWISGEFLRHTVQFDALRKIELGSIHSPLGPWLAKHPAFFAVAAPMSLLVELGAPFALMHRRLGQIWTALAVMFHVGVLATMAILFAYPTFGFAFASFFRVERLASRIEALWHRRFPPPELTP